MFKEFKKLNENKRFSYLARRCFAFMLDWYLSAVFANIISMIFYSILKLDNQNIIILISMIISSIIYFIIIPSYLWSGQTPMQRAMQIKVVDNNLNDVSLKTFFIRYLYCLIFEGTLYLMTSTLVFTILSTFNTNTKMIDNVIGTFLFISTILSLMYAFKDKKNTQCFHDILTKTKVIDIK
ncbi:MAG: RDD family protein [Anaerorhabdus sp.]